MERAALEAGRAARAELHREEHARAAVAEERLRIARELHDTVAHAVSVMVLHAGAVRSRLPEPLAREQDALGEVERTGRRAVAELRRLLGVLRTDDTDGAGASADSAGAGSSDGTGRAQHGRGVPANPAVAPLPVLGDLDRLVEQTRQLGLQVDLQADLDGAGSALEPAVEISCYRIIQEALTNVRKHARAHRVLVRLDRAGECLRLHVSDDGVGVTGEPGAGHGLTGIRERVEVYGGTLTTTSPPGGGFALQVELPLVSGGSP